MKNQYFGDINDFHKYCILSAISQQTGSPICFVWMLTPNDDSAEGGKRHHFKNPEQWRSKNPDLFDFLHKHNVAHGKRTVDVMKHAPGFQNAVFVGARLERECNQHPVYFTAVDQVIRPNDLLFFDPDNGLEVKSVPRTRSAAIKFLYWQDLIPRYARGHSAVIYQHFPRKPRVAYTLEKLHTLENKLNGSRAFSIRTTNVLFLVAAQPAHAGKIQAALENHFDRDRDIKTKNAFEIRDQI